MKKLTFVSLLVVLTLLLAACGNAGNNTTGNNAGELGTPVTGVTDEVPVTGETPLATTEVVETEPVVTEAVATETSVVQEPAETMTPAEGTDANVADEEGLEGLYPDLLSEVLDLEIVTQECEELAEIDGVVVSRGDGQILYVVGVTGGAFELDDEVLIPWGALDVNVEVETTLDDAVGTQATPVATGDATLVTPEAEGEVDCGLYFNNEAAMLNAGVEDLSGAPSVFDEGEDVELNTVVSVEDWDAELRSYWTGLGVEVNQAVAGEDVAEGETGQLGSAVVIRDVGELNLRNLADEDMGDIQDFIVDPEAGQITHVILSVGGFLGIGERYVPVPWTALNWQVDEDGTYILLLDANQERLENAPGYDSLGEFPDVQGEGWDVDLVDYWTVES